MLKLPTQTQKPSRASRAVHKDLDSDIELEDDDEDDHPCGGDGKRLLTTRQVVLASITFHWKKQLNEAEIALQLEETARKLKHLSS